VLGHVLDQLLRMLHPIIPFVTDELWCALTKSTSSVMVASWPVADGALIDDGAEASVELLQRVVTEVRRFRSDQGLKPGQRVAATIEGMTEHEELVRSLVRLDPAGDGFTATATVTIASGFSAAATAATGAAPNATTASAGAAPNATKASAAGAVGGTAPNATAADGAAATATAVGGAAQGRRGEIVVAVDTRGSIDVAAEKARLAKDRAAAEKEIAQATAKLGNEGFLAKAPADVVGKLRDRLAVAQADIARIDDALARLAA
jgi:valyl-tRNA synthetase